MPHFLSRSFGILALLASVFALFSCRGPWLKEHPAWFVIVPLGISILLAWLGISLLRKPVASSGKVKPGTVLFAKMIIGLAAVGGIILTTYFHGDSDADRQGVQLLHGATREMGPSMVIGLLVLASVAVVGIFKWMRSKNLPTNQLHPSPASPALPIKIVK